MSQRLAFNTSPVDIVVPLETDPMLSPRLDITKSVSVIKIWFSIARLWFLSTDRKRAYAWTTAAIASSFANMLLLLKVSYVQNSFQSALSEKEQDDFYSAVYNFSIIIIVAAPMFALVEYIDRRMVVEWRSWLAHKLILMYYNNKAYFLLKLDPEGIDNPDQRLTEDVHSFVSASTSLAIGMLRQLFYCFAFTGLLYSIAPNLVFFLFSYAALGSGLIGWFFGRRLQAITNESLQREADLRFSLIKTRESAESIAFYNGDAREQKCSTHRLQGAVNTQRRRIFIEAILSFWQNVYSYATILMPALLMAPRYFKGEVRFGDISQVSYAFGRIESAVSYFINNLASLASLAAQTERIETLINALAHSTSVGAPSALKSSKSGRTGSTTISLTYSPDQQGVELNSLTIMTPHGERSLARNITLTVLPGSSLLIKGSSGSGKTSLLCAIAGLWTKGSGSVVLPLPENLMFLPQKPYMPLGTLRDQLKFPFTSSSSSSSTSSLQYVDQDGDTSLLELLDQVGLPNLASRVGGLNAELDDWAHVLSLGEQQRLAFARLLRRCPPVAFLDEATSALDEKLEAKLYSLLQKKCQCYISVGHRASLSKYHTMVLENMDEAEWSLSR